MMGGTSRLFLFVSLFCLLLFFLLLRLFLSVVVFRTSIARMGDCLCSAYASAAGFPGNTVLKQQTVFFFNNVLHIFPPSSCEYDPHRVNSAYQCCLQPCVVLAQMVKVGTSSHFVISYKTKHHQISGNSSLERINITPVIFLMIKYVLSLFVILTSNHPVGSRGSHISSERDLIFTIDNGYRTPPVNVTNPLLHCTQVRKCRLYIDFHYTVECFKDALENHGRSEVLSRATFVPSAAFSSSLTAHETTVAQSDTVHQHYPLFIYLLRVI